MYSYCSQECQKKDWVNGHKKLCPVLVEINSVDRPVEPRTWSEYRHELVSISSPYGSQAFQIIHDAYRLRKLVKTEAWKSLRPKLLGNDQRILLYVTGHVLYVANVDGFQIPTTLCQLPSKRLPTPRRLEALSLLLMPTGPSLHILQCDSARG